MAHILVMEDDDQFREMLREMLESAGYQVTEAANGEVGISSYRESPTDLIILDIFMPRFIITCCIWVGLARTAAESMAIFGWIAMVGGSDTLSSSSDSSATEESDSGSRPSALGRAKSTSWLTSFLERRPASISFSR